VSNEQPGSAPGGGPDLRLRSDRPTVKRLSRKVLIGLGATAAIGVFGLGFWALQSNHKAQPTELYNTDSRNIAEGLETLPHDYSGISRNVPPIGQPLPGDLGRPILNAQRGWAQVSAEDQRLAQERDAARISRLFVSAVSVPREAAMALPPAAPPASAGAGGAGPSSDPTATQNMQDQKRSFLNRATDRRTVSPDRLAKPASPYVLQAGSVIPAALITGIRSDLPGEVIAQVTADVYDSPTGRYLLIPQGAKLLGQYNSEISFAQSRVQLVWTRLILPNGNSIVLEREPAADTQGYAGLEDEVDNHWGTLFKAALLSTILSVGAEAGTSDSENNLAQAIREGASQSFNQAGEQIVERNLNVQPTLTIRPGFPVRVIVDRDLMLAPYK